MPRREFRHGFRPGKLVAGLAVLAAALLYAGDAAGSWQTPWFVVFPVVFGGLFLAGAVTWVHYGIRRRRSASRASSGEHRGTGEHQRQPGHQIGEVVAVVVRLGLPAHRQPQAQRDQRAAERGEPGQQPDEGADADGELTEGDGVAEALGALERQVDQGGHGGGVAHAAHQLADGAVAARGQELAVRELVDARVDEGHAEEDPQRQQGVTTCPLPEAAAPAVDRAVGGRRPICVCHYWSRLRVTRQLTIRTTKPPGSPGMRLTL